LYYAEIIASFFAVIYIFSAAREQYISWWWSVISSLFWAYASFVYFRLYVDFILQIFYIGIAFVGMYHWQRDKNKRDVLPITRMSINQHLLVIVPGFCLAYIFGYIFAKYTSAASTYIDSLTTVFSVFNTFLLVRKKIENWIYWMIIDAVMAYLFFSRGGYYFAALYSFYVFMSIDGYLKWRKKLFA